MNKKVEYKHPNGYSAILYGQSSMSIYYQGKQVSHTGFRNVNTEIEVLKLLEEYPEFVEKLKTAIDNGLLDNDERNI